MAETRIDGPRLARRDEYPEILDLVDRCFQRPDGVMEAEWAHCYDESQPEQHAIIKRDGRVVANVGCVFDTLIVGDAELPSAGITGVATDFRHRGEGYMSQLLEFWLDRMDERGVVLSELGGDRKRYGRFGWEVAGRDRYYRITDRSFVDRPDRDEDVAHSSRDEYVERYDGSDEAIAFVTELYRTKRLRVKRDRDAFRTRLGRSNLETVTYTESGAEAYLTFSRGHRGGWIYEVAGSERGVRVLLAHVFDVFGPETLRCRLHPSDPLNALFGAPDVSSRWRTVPHRSVNIRDLPALLEAFSGQLARRWNRIGGEAGTLVLGIASEDNPVAMVWSDDGVTAGPTDDEPDLELDRLAMTRLLFGYPETVSDYDGHPFLDAVLPLDCYLPRTDQV